MTGAAVTEFNATFLYMYFHIALVNVANSNYYYYANLVPSCTRCGGCPAAAVVQVITMGHFMLIALLTYSFAAPSGQQPLCRQLT